MEIVTRVSKAGAATDLDRIYRKIAWRLLPFLFICYVVNYIDRANIGFAKLQFTKDIGISEAAYGLGAGLFYIGYVLFEIPSNFYLQKAGIRATLVRIMVLWGLVSGLMSFVSSPGQLYLARFLLGVAEAGFFPGVILYLTYWFPAPRRARITSLLVLALVVAGMFGSLVSGWILTAASGLFGLKGWQALFVLEAIPAIALGILALFALDDGPATATWLSAEEKELLRADLDLDRQTKAARKTGFADAFRDPRVYIASLIYSTIGAASAVISLWIPTLIRNAGVKDLQTVGLLAMIPYAAAGIGMILTGRSSDRRLERRWHVVVPAVLASFAFLALGLPNVGMPFTIAMLCIASAGVYGAISVFWTLPPAYLSGRSAAAGIALISSVGAGLGGFGGATVVGWITQATGSIFAGIMFVSGLMVLGALALLAFIPARVLGEARRR
ncbi:MAG: MFS transporter [Xanthobacteraceae bacterium]|nr:MFS transporter [Xanthobacteraceae bacterium]